MNEYDDEYAVPREPEDVEGDPIFLGQIYDYATLKSNKVHELTPPVLSNEEAEGKDLAFSDAVEDTDFTAIRAMVLGSNVPPYAIAFSAGDRLVVPGGGISYITVTATVHVKWPWAGTPALLFSGFNVARPTTLAQPLPDGTTTKLIKIDDYTWKLTDQIPAGTAGLNIKNVYVDLYARCHVRYSGRFDFTTEGAQAPARNSTDNLPAPDGGTLAGTMSGGVLDLGTINMDGNCGEYNCYSFIAIDITTSYTYVPTGLSTPVDASYGWHVSGEWGDADLIPGGGAGSNIGAPGAWGWTWRATLGENLWEITLDLIESSTSHATTLTVRACRVIHDDRTPDNGTAGAAYDHPEVYGWNGNSYQWYSDMYGSANFTQTFNTPQFLDRPASLTLALPLTAGNGTGRDVGGTLTPMANPVGSIPCSNPCNFTFTQTWRGWPAQSQMPIPAGITPQYPPYPARPYSLCYGL